MKASFTLSVFDILLFKDRLVLGHAKRIAGSERVKLSVKNKEAVQLLLELLQM